MSDLTEEEQNCLSDEGTVGFVLLDAECGRIASAGNIFATVEEAIEACLRYREKYTEPAFVCEVTGARPQ
ncbi:hypothetical protein LCGC14_2016810 [marine sediment metagenome]|uniref:Uncharacterized protein n=1 Tax=marine sediment metagenome TaxID=412755 RepID=A0A0F9EYU6_9ZZZZ